jgi:hypothetical protein
MSWVEFLSLLRSKASKALQSSLVASIAPQQAAKTRRMTHSVFFNNEEWPGVRAPPPPMRDCGVFADDNILATRLNARRVEFAGRNFSTAGSLSQRPATDIEGRGHFHDTHAPVLSSSDNFASRLKARPT